MNIFVNKCNQALYPKIATFVFFGYIIWSLSLSLFGAVEIYEECDSSSVPNMISGFPEEAKNFTGYLSFGPKLNWAKKARLDLIDYISKENLWQPIKAAFALPMSSTYSPGPGLLYGAILKNKGIAEFRGKALNVNVILYHIGLIILWYCFKRGGISEVASTIGVMWYGLSCSIFAYQFHFGSTIWNCLASIMIMWAGLIGSQSRRGLIIVSLFGVVGMLFSYLTVISWMASVFAVAISRNANFFESGLNKLAPRANEVIASLLIFIIPLLLLMVVFFPPGNSLRGGIDMSSIYAIVVSFGFIFLTLFGILSKPPVVLLVAQALIAIIIVGYGAKKIIEEFRRRRMSCLAIYSVFFLIFYLLMISFGLLSFAPSRHILFIAPVLYFIVAKGIDAASDNSKYIVSLVFLIASVPIAAYRIEQLKSADSEILSSINFENYKGIIIGDCSYQYMSLGNESQSKSIIALRNMSGEVYFVPKLLEEGVYLYLSQTIPPRLLFNSYEKPIEIEKSTYFTFNNFFRFPWDRPNNFYAAEVILKK